nr:Polyribonucleotide nucleotidyltransferase [Ipomoea batatas]GME19623.1 Polyribonucleotide nucleotidyltransferase [Ipomoea batatas]
MYRRSPNSLYHSILRRPFEKLTKPNSPFPSKSFSKLPGGVSEPNPFLKPSRTIAFLHPTSLNPLTHFKILHNLRLYSVETDKEVDKINLKFAEAREEIESAMESKETVYFDEEAECARAAVKEVLGLYEGLLAKVNENEKGVIQRSMGLKIEQLKAELEQLNE